jgi:hypothetical protein
VDAAGQVAQVGQRVLGVLVRRAGQRERAVVTGRLPVILWYAPVPEPVTIGACAVTVALPEQVAGLPRQWRNAVTNSLSRTAPLSRNEPRVNSRRRSRRCSGSIRPSG